ncbi:MAG: ATP synthase F1 subunit epsilon [Arsenophonus sp.]|nr:MAG: ATP synthase F1 subunit epsilon [Arsenophonus sp.]
MSIKTYHLIVVSPEKKIFDDFVKKVKITGIEGELGIYPQHISMLTLIKPCFLFIQKKYEEKVIYVSSGILEIQKNNVIIFSNIAIYDKIFDQNFNTNKLSIFKFKAEKYILSLNNINKIQELLEFKEVIKKFQIIKKNK